MQLQRKLKNQLHWRLNNQEVNIHKVIQNKHQTTITILLSTYSLKKWKTSLMENESPFGSL